MRSELTQAAERWASQNHAATTQGIRSGMSVQDLKALTALREQQNLQQRSSRPIQAPSFSGRCSPPQQQHLSQRYLDYEAVKRLPPHRSNRPADLRPSTLELQDSSLNRSPASSTSSLSSISSSSISSYPSSPCRIFMTEAGQYVELFKGVVNAPKRALAARMC